MNVFQEIEANILSSAKIAQYGAPSASVAILEGEDIQTHVFTTDSEDPQTKYLADSNTKPMTALGIARLVDQGLLKFNDSIADFADTGGFLHHPESGGMIRHVTIEMILTHTSGLVKKADCDHSKYPGFSRNACFQFSHFPGSKWHYDGAAFALVQLAMEKVSRMPFPELMKQLVVGPLGMTRTSWGQLPADEGNFAKPHIDGVRMQSQPALHPCDLSTTGMWSTPSDMLKAVSAVQKSLQASTTFLRRETARHMLMAEAKPEQLIGEPGEVARGWFTTSTVFAHRGGRSGGGYHCYFFGFYGPDMGDLQSTSFAAMTNSLGGLIAIRALINAVMYLKRWPRQENMPSSLKINARAPCSAPSTVEVDPEWEEWMGDWSRGSQRGWSLMKVADQPMLRFCGMEPVSLQPAAMPSLKFHDGRRELTFVCPTLPGMTARLSWVGSERVLELRLSFASTTLRREVNGISAG